MSPDEKAREYLAHLHEVLSRARREGFVFTVTGGQRKPYTLTVTVLPYSLERQIPDPRQPELFTPSTHTQQKDQ